MILDGGLNMATKKKVPAKKAPAKKIPAKKAPAKKIAVKEIPAKMAPRIVSKYEDMSLRLLQPVPEPTG